MKKTQWKETAKIQSSGFNRGERKHEKKFIKLLWIVRDCGIFALYGSSCFSSMAYPGYDWMAQAVSDLSAANAPSLSLWNQLSSLYDVCTLICAMMVCVGIQGKKSKLLRVGIYIFTAMEWVSAVGYSLFPLSDSGYAGTFQDRMHIVSTVLVVVLSIVSLVIIIIAGIKDKSCRSYGICAGIALGMMLVGALGMNMVPKAYFGVVERFSVFAATGFNAVLGIHLYLMDSKR